MTEEEWMSCHEPAELLASLPIAVAPYRLWQYVLLCLRGVRADTSAELLQRQLRGEVAVEELHRHRDELLAQAARRSGGARSQGRKPVRIPLDAQRASAGLALFAPSPWRAADFVTSETVHLLQRLQCEWLRCLFSNPFRPVAFDPAWRTETAVGIARGIYEERAFERMPILADALQDAGCDHPDILAHCREPGVHDRGCWVVDLLLGKS